MTYPDLMSLWEVRLPLGSLVYQRQITMRTAHFLQVAYHIQE